jgi:carboxylesterase
MLPLALLALFALLALLAFALLWRTRVSARAVERTVAVRLPVGADGVVLGAAAIDLREPAGEPPASAGVLLLHGFGDTPQVFSYLAADLHARGYAVYAPLLPGHGRTLREFAVSAAEEWLAVAGEALREMRERYGRVAAVGLSMGGALATIEAARTNRLDALVLLAPYFDAPLAVRRLARVSPLAGVLAPYLVTRSELSIRDPAERDKALGYGVTTPRLVRELLGIADSARAALPHVSAPTLYVQSREDNRLDPTVAERSFAALGARVKRLEWVEGCGHIITVDYGRERVVELVAEWLAEHLRPGITSGVQTSNRDS